MSKWTTKKEKHDMACPKLKRKTRAMTWNQTLGVGVRGVPLCL